MTDAPFITGIPDIDRRARLVPLDGDARDASLHELPTFAASSLLGPAPQRQWHVPNLIPAHTVTTLNGDGGTGKSLLGLQLAAATASGRSWLGQQVAEGPALFLTAEDDRAELHRRLVDVARSASVGIGELHRLTLLSLAGEDALLAMPAPGSNVIGATGLFRQIERWIAENRPRLVVLDTLADLFGGQENDRAQARQFIQLLRGLAIHHQTTVLLLAHPSLAGMSSGTGSSGSTAWNASVRSRLYLRRIVDDGYEQDPDVRLLTTVKANYGPTGGEIRLRWQDGVFAVEEGQKALDRAASSAKGERVFLKLLRQFAEEGRHVNHAGGRYYAPSAFAEHPENEGVSKRGYSAAMNGLFAAKRIAVEPYGPPSKRATKIVEVQHDG